MRLFEAAKEKPAAYAVLVLAIAFNTIIRLRAGVM
jgi:hypothetical protein